MNATVCSIQLVQTFLGAVLALIELICEHNCSLHPKFNVEMILYSLSIECSTPEIVPWGMIYSL